MTTMQSKSRVLIIGVGNQYRSDDAAGLVVAEMLNAKKYIGVDVLKQSGEGASLIECWKNTDSVVLIDAIHTGAEPGTIFRIDVQKQPLQRKYFRHSTHSFGVADAVELARAMNQLPKQFVIFGIEAKNYIAGTELSPEVDQATKEIVDCVIRELENNQVRMG
ncbi:hydrogenase maturation protease [bacterium]|nr:hydrogenase maturation protease [bacterium]